MKINSWRSLHVYISEIQHCCASVGHSVWRTQQQQLQQFSRSAVCRKTSGCWPCRSLLAARKISQSLFQIPARAGLLGYWATGRRPPTASATNLAFSLTPIPALLLFLHHFSSISIANWASPSAWNRSLAASVLASTPATVPTTDIERPTTARAGTPATSATCSSHAAMSSAATSRSMARQQMGKIPFGSGPSGLATSAARARSAVTMAIRVAAVSRLTRPARIA